MKAFPHHPINLHVIVHKKYNLLPACQMNTQVQGSIINMKHGLLGRCKDSSRKATTYFAYQCFYGSWFAILCGLNFISQSFKGTRVKII